MGNVSLPTPVALAGGAICILGGYLLGVVAGPDTNSQTTATVQSYDRDTGRLCLEGDGVEGKEGASDGTLCGTWRRAGGSSVPAAGDEFRFVSVSGASQSSGGPRATLIYGDVVP